MKLIRQTVVPAGVRSPREALSLMVAQNAGALADKIISTALAENSGVGGANVALRAIEMADPAVLETIEFSGDLTRDQLNGLSFVELRRRAEAALAQRASEQPAIPA